MHSSGDLVEDLTHNYFLETGARSGKLRVYEMCDHPAARALTGYLLVRGGVHQVAYARALENLTGANISKLFPTPRIPTDEDPRVPAAHREGRAPQALPLLAGRLHARSSPSSTARTRRPARTSRSSTRRPRASRPTTCRPQTDVFAPDYAPEEIAEIAQKLRKAAGLPDKVTGIVANDGNGSANGKAPRTKAKL